MDCSELITRYTDYADGVAPSHEVRAIEEHLATCSSCRRYKTVLENGAALLRSLPPAELQEDFAPRLQHRLYHVHEERSISDQVTSGAPALTVLGIAVLLTAVAWAPMLRGSAPVVELDPIVVDRVPSRIASPPGILFSGSLGESQESGLDADLWDDARLYEYSQLHQRYHGNGGPRQVGFAPQR